MLGEQGRQLRDRLEEGPEEGAVQSKAVTYADAAASKGPAEEVAGAKSGGTVQVYQEAGLSHLDPARSTSPTLARSPT